MKVKAAISEKKSPRQFLAADQVLRMVADYCQALQPGDPVPPHQELMRLFDASERSVRGALDELRRQGKIVRRRGARTFVAHVNDSGVGGSVPECQAPQPGHGSRNGTSAQASLPAPAINTGVRSNTVVAVLQPDGSFFDLALQSLMRQAKSDRLAVECRLLAGSETDSFEVPSSRDGALGYVLFRRDFAPLAEKLQTAGHRVVLMGQQFDAARREVPTIYSSHRHGTRLAMRHLIELGHRSIVGYHQHDGMVESALEAQSLGIEVRHTQLEESEVELWGRDPEAVRRFFGSSNSPTAIVCWNDLYAIKLINLLHRAGLRVPQDVSVVGYDNMPQGRELHPALTSIDAAVDLQVNLALRLLQQVEGVLPGQTICIEPTLVVRESTAAPSHVLCR